MEEPQEPRLGSGASQDLGHPCEPEEVAEGGLRTDTATYLLLLKAREVPSVVEPHLLPFPVLHESGSCRIVGSSQGHWALWMTQDLPLPCHWLSKGQGPHK